MRIGIDGGALSGRDIRFQVGVYRITTGLLNYISHKEYSNNYRIYLLPGAGEDTRFDHGENFSIRTVYPRKGWNYLGLPMELIRNPVDVFLGLSQSLPRFTLVIKSVYKSKFIGFIYDIGFIKNPELYPDSAEKLKRQTDYMVKHADKIITISEATKYDVVHYYNIPDRFIDVCYPGKLEDRSKFDTKANIYKNPYFLFVGSLKPGKNIPYLLRSYKQYLDKVRKPIGLVLIGGDYWRDSGIDKIINENHLKNQVKFLGHVSDSQLAGYYSNAVAFISPSISEGFCLPAVEAGSWGCPAIVSDLTVFREILGGSAIYVDLDNPEKLANAMIKFTSDKKLRQRLSINALSNSQKYSWEKFGKCVMEIIKG